MVKSGITNAYKNNENPNDNKQKKLKLKEN